MASLKVIRKRIASVKSTQQITKAMKMVAAAKLRRAQEAAQSARPYAEKLAELLRNVAARAADVPHPLLATRDVEQTVDLIAITSDRGLCGGYNANLIRAAGNFLAAHQSAHVRVTAIGNKGLGHFRKTGADIIEEHTHLPVGPTHALALELAARMTAMENATTNASEMINRLTLDMNRARQAAITTELMEIVSGAEALKG